MLDLNQFTGHTPEWYAKPSAGGIQGLIIDANTGRTVAVSYEQPDMVLLAAAPELLELCRAQQAEIERLKQILWTADEIAAENSWITLG